MQKSNQSSVLIYGNSLSLDMVRKELPKSFGLPVLHIDPATHEAARSIVRRKACLLIYDQSSAESYFVEAFQRKHPDIPVVCLNDKADPQLEVSFRENSRIETSGLPQVLQVLEECWSMPLY